LEDAMQMRIQIVVKKRGGGAVIALAIKRDQINIFSMKK
jgi:hypothetical protein